MGSEEPAEFSRAPALATARCLQLDITRKTATNHGSRLRLPAPRFLGTGGPGRASRGGLPPQPSLLPPCLAGSPTLVLAIRDASGSYPHPEPRDLAPGKQLEQRWGHQERYVLWRKSRGLQGLHRWS